MNVTRAVSAALSDEEKTVALLRAATQRDGLNPHSFLLLLSDAVETKAWEHMPDGRITFLQFINRCGLSPDAIEKAMKLPIDKDKDGKRFDRTRAEVRRLLGEALEPMRESRRPTKQEASNKSGNARLIHNTAVTNLQRLKAKRPDLAAKVIAGELSANAAAIEAGFRRKTFTIPDDLRAAAKALAHHFGPAHALALADYIEEEVRGGE